jgi:hypothetical protein
MLFAGGLVLPVLLSQPRKAPASGEWPMYGHDLASTRYSPLTQINTRNVARLTQVWSYHLQPSVEGGGAPEGGQAPLRSHPHRGEWRDVPSGRKARGGAGTRDR